MHIARELEIGYSTVRRIIDTFAGEGILRTEKVRIGRRNFVQFTVLKNITYFCPDPFSLAKKAKKIDPNRLSPFYKINKSSIENLSIYYAETALDAKQPNPSEDDDIDWDLYPHLTEIGFGPTQLRQIVKHWQKLELDINAGLPHALERADWWAKPEHRKENALGYVFAMLKNGMPSPPPGFKSRQEIIAEALHEQAEKIRKLKEQHFEDSFTVWWHELPPDEKQKIDAQNRTGAWKEEFRKHYFREHAYQEL